MKDGISLDRLVRHAQQENEGIRGRDHDDKTVLSQEYQLEVLGKEMGYEKLSTQRAL